MFNCYSSYTNYFGNLMTLEQKRPVIDDKYDPNQDPNAYMDPYMRKSMALKEFKQTLKSNGNYSFGGATPLYKMRDSKISRSQYSGFRPVSAAQAQKYGHATITPGTDLERKLGFHPLNATKGKRKNKAQKPGVDGPSIYDLVGQKIDVPQGLLYRGKYCGKSKLRQRMNEFGDNDDRVSKVGSTTSKKNRSEVTSVQPI